MLRDPQRQHHALAFLKPSPACRPLDHTLSFPRRRDSLSQEHKSLHIGVRCSPKASKPQRQASQSCPWPLGFLPAAAPAQACSMFPCRSNQQKMLEIEGIHCHLKKCIKKKKHLSCFLCEINSDTEMSEGENESLNRSLQQGENGGKRTDFENNYISFLFFPLNTACSSENKQSPAASSPQLFLGPQHWGRKKWYSLLCIFLLYFCGS